MENVDRLPKWAQARIRQLEAEVEALERQNATLRGDEPSAVVLYDYVRGERGVPAGNALRHYVTIETPRGPRKSWIEARPKDDGLDVMCDVPIIVRPRASNTIYVEPDKEY